MKFGDLYKNRPALGPDKPDPTPDPMEGRIIAVLIGSAVLEDHVWLVLDGSFDPGDGLAVYHADELQFLKDKDADTLREIHKIKLAFPGARVRQ